MFEILWDNQKKIDTSREIESFVELGLGFREVGFHLICIFCNIYAQAVGHDTQFHETITNLLTRWICLNWG